MKYRFGQLVTLRAPGPGVPPGPWKVVCINYIDHTYKLSHKGAGKIRTIKATELELL